MLKKHVLERPSRSFLCLQAEWHKLSKNACGFLINAICWWHMPVGFVCVNYNYETLKKKNKTRQLYISISLWKVMSHVKQCLLCFPSWKGITNYFRNDVKQSWNYLNETMSKFLLFKNIFKYQKIFSFTKFYLWQRLVFCHYQCLTEEETKVHEKHSLPRTVWPHFWHYQRCFQKTLHTPGQCWRFFRERQDQWSMLNK